MKKKIPFFSHAKNKSIILDEPMSVPPSITILVFTEEGELEKQTAPIKYHLNQNDETLVIDILTDYKNGYIILN